MTREQKVSMLIQYLKQENQGYASIPDPIDEGEQRRLLRSLMNVRYPGHASAEYEKLQDELLQEEAEEKGIVTCNDIPVIEQEYPCSEIKNSDRISLWRGDITRLGVDAIVNVANSFSAVLYHVMAASTTPFTRRQEFSFVMNVQKSWQNKDMKNR